MKVAVKHIITKYFHDEFADHSVYNPIVLHYLYYLDPSVLLDWNVWNLSNFPLDRHIPSHYEISHLFHTLYIANSVYNGLRFRVYQ